MALKLPPLPESARTQAGVFISRFRYGGAPAWEVTVKGRRTPTPARRWFVDETTATSFAEEAAGRLRLPLIDLRAQVQR